MVDGARAVEVAREAKDPQVLQPTLGDYGRLLFMAGRAADAEAVTDELLAVAAVDEPHLVWSLWFVPISLVLVSRGRAAEVHRLAEAARPETPWIRAGMAIAEGDLSAAAEILAQIGSLSHEAYLRLLAAEQLLDAGRRGEGEEQLRRALAFFRAVGGTRYLRRGDALMGAAATGG
jgi:hypothetical protein